MEEDKDSSRGFRVTDRRRFTEDSEAQEGTHESEEAGAAAPEPEPGAAASPGQGPAGGPSPDEPVSFSTFLLGLSTPALPPPRTLPTPLSAHAHRQPP